ncbi:hypothetical protein [Lysinibacillus parviboronicapiens]|uniref:hypothetical protein n=1 Tax=Lysinibacillus parviboronicapiens TaxID=436516 RepID=UPI000D3A170E|nr:hypothetical protein [Lysinibacillus parviboronicapiens]
MNDFYIFEDELAFEGSSENVKGIRIMIDGDFKQVLDKLKEHHPNCSSYSEIVALAVTNGITEIIQEIKANS